MAAKFKRREVNVGQYTEGVLAGDRVMLSKAITLVESSLDSDNILAEKVIDKIIPHTGKSIRIGITGVPGVGKSTFIETFGDYLTTTLNKQIAVLTIDPSSQRTKGSILGDKTRMERLSTSKKAFIRPSPSGSTLGGVHSKTREAMLLCEAAGFDIVLVETVGVGQSETSVKGIVDFFLLLMLSNAGDELQGIKRGIMEMADAIAINKVDGDNIQAGLRAKAEYQNALHMFPPNLNDWIPEVKTCSAYQEIGIKEIWEMIDQFVHLTRGNQWFEKNRRDQNLSWMDETIRYQLERDFYTKPSILDELDGVKSQVAEGLLPPTTAALKLLTKYGIARMTQTNKQ